MATLMVGVSFLVRLDFTLRDLTRLAPQPGACVLCAAMAGLIIGYFVPSWVRELESEPGQAPTGTAGAASPSARAV
jgi:hypothetical protein